jgi:DNA-binding transcriptional ArsR family regulator
VTELTELFAKSQLAISKHLNMLRRAGRAGSTPWKRRWIRR